MTLPTEESDTLEAPTSTVHETASLRTAHEPDEHAAFLVVLDALRTLTPEGRARILKTVGTYYDVPHIDSTLGAYSETSANRAIVSGSQAREPSFSNREDMTAKQFMALKEPATDIERVVCLAYYLTHYRDTPYFKTIDISKLNTEAAQLKLSNATVAVNNAALKGFLTSASSGNKQITAFGELFVAALPDREQAKAVAEKTRRRKSANRKTSDRKSNGAT